MFDRPHHQRIYKLLQALNQEFLAKAECYFGGGTAIVLQLGEYRESVDVDFICSSKDGYRAIRNTVKPGSLGRLSNGRLDLRRDVIADQYGVRTQILIDEIPIKFEIVLESRIDVSGEPCPSFGVPLLSRGDCQAEKLLANADRWRDQSTHFRDLVDLAFTINAWGWPNYATWEKVFNAYGPHVIQNFSEAVQAIRGHQQLAGHLEALGVPADREVMILESLQHGSVPSSFLATDYPGDEF